MAYPSSFISIGDIESDRLFVPILQVIMFCMGTTLSIGDFTRVIRMPVGVLVGLVCQFTIMPAVGFGLAYGFGFPPEIGAGIVLVGSSPSGLASIVFGPIMNTTASTLANYWRNHPRRNRHSKGPVNRIKYKPRSGGWSGGWPAACVKFSSSKLPVSRTR